MTETTAKAKEKLTEKPWKYIKRGALFCLAPAAVVGFVIFLVWAILHPQGPRFVLRDVTIVDFNISQPNFITSRLQVTLSSINPNHKTVIFYDKVDVYASYRNQEVTFRSQLPATNQGHHEESVWSPILKGVAVPVEPYLTQSLYQDLEAHMLLLNIKVDGCVRWYVGPWKSSCYRLLVNCPNYIFFSGHIDDAGRPMQNQLPQRCAVDFS